MLIIVLVMRGKITKGAVGLVSLIVFAAGFFWVQDRVTEMTIRGVGSIKTAVNTANQYVEDIRQIKTDLEQQKEKITTQIAQLEKLAKEESQLKREVGLRHLDGEQFLKIMDGDPKGEFEILYGAEDSDSIFLAYDLRVLLERAGWKFVSISAVPLATLFNLKNIDFPKNFRIEVHSLTGDDGPVISPEEKPRTLYSVVAGAIMVGLGGVQVSQAGENPSLPDNRVRIMVYPR